MKIILNFISILLLPFIFSGIIEFLKITFKLDLMKNIYFFSGGFFYLFLHLFFVKFNKIFIYQHELTHGFFSLIFGGDIKKIKVKETGGTINVTKPNFIVALSPYVFPLYAFLLVFIYYILRAINVSCFDRVYDLFLFLFGFLIFFHFTYTYIALKNKQSDLSKNGYMISLVFIFLSNIILVVLVLKIVNSSNVSVRHFLISVIKSGINFYRTMILFIKNRYFIKKIII